MRYYIKSSDEKLIDVIDETGLIGEEGFQNNKFFTGGGWDLFQQVILKSTKELDLTPYYDIINEYGKEIGFKKFLEYLETKQVMES